MRVGDDGFASGRIVEVLRSVGGMRVLGVGATNNNPYFRQALDKTLKNERGDGGDQRGKVISSVNRRK